MKELHIGVLEPHKRLPAQSNQLQGLWAIHTRLPRQARHMKLPGPVGIHILLLLLLLPDSLQQQELEVSHIHPPFLALCNLNMQEPLETHTRLPLLVLHRLARASDMKASFSSSSFLEACMLA